MPEYVTLSVFYTDEDNLQGGRPLSERLLDFTKKPWNSAGGCGGLNDLAWTFDGDAPLALRTAAAIHQAMPQLHRVQVMLFIQQSDGSTLDIRWNPADPASPSVKVLDPFGGDRLGDVKVSQVLLSLIRAAAGTP